MQIIKIHVCPVGKTAREKEDMAEGKAAIVNTVSTRQLRKGLRETRRWFDVAVGWRGEGNPK